MDVPDQKIHHCRACGEGFCGECSDYKRPVPERGWGPEELVRVCRDCYGPLGMISHKMSLFSNNNSKFKISSKKYFYSSHQSYEIEVAWKPFQFSKC